MLIKIIFANDTSVSIYFNNGHRDVINDICTSQNRLLFKKIILKMKIRI